MAAKAAILTLQRQIRELQCVLGKKTLENQILRGAVKLTPEKSDGAFAVVTEAGIQVKSVARTLGVARSQRDKRLKGAARPRTRYRNADDAELLAPLRSLVDKRPTLRLPADRGADEPGKA